MGCSRARSNKWGQPRYTAYYWDLRGRQRSAGTFARKRDADRAWRRAEARIADCRFINLASGRQRFHRYVTEVWLPGHVMELTTRQGYHGIVTKYLLPAFGPIRMNEILPAHIRDFLHRLHNRSASAHTLARCKTVLSAIFTTALNDQVIYFHPCTGVKTPTPPKRALRILTPREFTRHWCVPGSQRWSAATALQRLTQPGPWRPPQPSRDRATGTDLRALTRLTPAAQAQLGQGSIPARPPNGCESVTR